jgi:hypothetical protein
MFGEEFGFDYFQQRHSERLQAAERARLVRAVEAAERALCPPRPWAKRVLALTGTSLIWAGSRLRQAGA